MRCRLTWFPKYVCAAKRNRLRLLGLFVFISNIDTEDLSTTGKAGLLECSFEQHSTLQLLGRLLAWEEMVL